MMTRANDCADEREAEASRLLMLMTPPRGAPHRPGLAQVASISGPPGTPPGGQQGRCISRGRTGALLGA